MVTVQTGLCDKRTDLSELLPKLLLFTGWGMWQTLADGQLFPRTRVRITVFFYPIGNKVSYRIKKAQQSGTARLLRHPISCSKTTQVFSAIGHIISRSCPDACSADSSSSSRVAFCAWNSARLADTTLFSSFKSFTKFP